MMSILEYSVDVNLDVEKILALCDSLGIDYIDENSTLSDEDIILLDNNLSELENMDDEEENEDEEEILENEDEDEEEQLVEKFGSRKKIEKIKTKTATRDDNKAIFQSEKKNLYKHKKKLKSNVIGEDDNFVVYKEGMTVMDIATIMKVNPAELIKKLISLGVMANMNASLSYEVAEILVADYNKTLKKIEDTDISKFDEDFEIADKEEDLVERAPVITIMGHVDHGKTSLLDAIRESNVVSGEAGGITQAISSYQINYKGKPITFIDTPGHAAFTEMRARGAKVTDIIIVIVAADDGVKPQTEEAIDHAKAAGVPIIVAINKIDKPDANKEKTLEELARAGLQPEVWGGDVIVNYISAKTKEGINDLLDNILLVSEMQGYKANPNRYAIGTVIEAYKDVKTGVVASVLVQNGTLRIGDPICCGTIFGKIRNMKNDLGESITEALPSTPVEIIGLSEVPDAGDKFMAFETEKQAKEVSDKRIARLKSDDLGKTNMSLDELFSAIKKGEKSLNVILKTDTKGSLEAIKQSLAKINIEGVEIKIVRGSVGAISESDIVLAKASEAIVIGFNVRPSSNVVEIAKTKEVQIKLYDIIYKLIEDLEKSILGSLDPEYEEVVLGSAEILAVFKFSKIGNIAGCRVLDGIIKNTSNCRVIRDGVVIYTGKIKTLQKEKDQIKEVAKGFECGITLENYQDIKEKDIIEAYELKEIKKI